ncbi:hypothetical protein M3O48_14715 [Xanthomonas nasturtii]|uniref:hypothetical protein n=1 Tax=Xanthomonas nasturtii TaxID=1843581 RepID=UPI002011BFCF|nr:hypothetical protein [Xanthomonas nasturtii]MCL1533469.1 hypothetical protein [Xanthomonas nasturtii]MCL1545404.1 hypothetical protein [Xanthomonas nasturtii]MCL1560658.1 hypothetical protein [Xanthomonas nasturtii]
MRVENAAFRQVDFHLSVGIVAIVDRTDASHRVLSAVMTRKIWSDAAMQHGHVKNT